MRALRMLRLPIAALLATAASVAAADPATHAWTGREQRILASLRLVRALPPSPGNRYADDPRAAELGRRLFFDPGFSANGEIACASCHRPALHFTDGRATAVGLAPLHRNAPTLVGAGFGRWFYWDGRRDSLWAQALTPLEAHDEMGGSRIGVLRRIAGDPRYRADYEAIFGPLPEAVLDAALPAEAGPLGEEPLRKAWFRIGEPTRDALDRAYANVGKAIEAFERTLLPTDSRFDRYVDAVQAGDDAGLGQLDEQEVAGLRLFIDATRTQCLQCHNGPQLSNGGFHNVGTGTFSGPALDFGRVLGIQAVLMDGFNCLGRYSDAGPEDCAPLRFLNADAHVPLEGAFKTPSLRDVAETAPYLHDGRYATLREVIDHYVSPPADVPHELRPLALSEPEREALVAFLRSLSGETR